MTSSALFVALVAALAIGTTEAAECHGQPDPNAVDNMMPILDGAPKLVREVKNGKLYTIGDGDDEIPLVHLYGTPYEMGYAHAMLQNDSIVKLMNGVMAYIDDQAAAAINGSIHNLKPWFVEMIAEVGVSAALELTSDATKKFTGEYFQDELRGMSDYSGLSFKTMQHVHMIGELTKGSCSMYGAWGEATASTGALMQLRALDWDVTGPFKDYPELIVYHPTEGGENGHAFANLAWTGFIGSITGISSEQMAISEIGVSFPDSSFGKESRFGTPFTYLLRDILQFDTDIPSVQKHLGDAHRTCDLIFGVSDGKANEFRSVQYSASVANFFTDNDMQPVNETWHPRMKNVVYYGMDWLCPGFNSVLHKQLEKHYGNITAYNTIRDIVPIVQTGDLHIAVYDLTNMNLHFATARRDGASGPALAYDRTFISVDMKTLFAEPAPTV